MAIRAGLASQFMFVKESVFGTGVTVTKALPVKTAKVQLNQTWMQGSGLFSGDFLDRSTQRVAGTKHGELNFTVDVQNKDMGPLIQQLMGTTVTPVQQGGTAAYLQTHTLADVNGKSLTVQLGVPEGTGTVRPYTATGTKLTECVFTVQPTELFQAEFTGISQNVLEATSLASVSYSSALTPFSTGAFGAGTGVAIKTGTIGSEALVSGIKQITVDIKRLLQNPDDATYLGNSGLMSEPQLNAKAQAITGVITADYLDKTKFADLYPAGTTTSIVVEAVGVNIASTFNYTFRITLPVCYFDGNTPEVDGPDVVSGDFPFTVLYDGTNLPKIEIIEVATSI